MKIIIAGSRTITDYYIVKNAINVSNTAIKATEIVCGMASGVDLLGKRWAEENNIPIKEFPADWERFGKSAGYKRNEEMAEYADALLAIWDKKSRGTKHMIDLARKHGLKIYIFRLTTVVNIKDNLGYDVRIDRSTKWGNLYQIDEHNDRKEAIQKYKKSLLGSYQFLADLPQLQGKILGCWCKPLPCHGDVLADFCNKGIS